MSKNLLAVLIFIVSIALAACGGPCNRSLLEKHEIQKLTLQTGVSGNFFLLSGTIDEKASYGFDEIQDDGAAIRVNIEAAKVLRYEEEGLEEAYIEHYMGIDSNGSGCFIHDLPASLDDYSLQIGTSEWYEIHIPLGSIFEVEDLSEDSVRP